MDLSANASRSHRVAIIDIGSNSLRLVVYDELKRAPIPLYNEKAMCGLGRGLASSGRLNPEGVVAARAAIRRFIAMARNMEVTALHLIATAAVRDAEDGEAFVQSLRDEFRVDILIITGEHEARLGAYGICASMHEPDGITGDLGGGSMELVRLKEQTIANQVTLSIGPLRLIDQHKDDRKRMREAVRQEVDRAAWLERSSPKQFYAIGGNLRTLAKIHMLAEGYPLRHIHGYTITGKECAKFARDIADLSDSKIANLPGAANKRVPMLGPTAVVLAEIMERLEPQQVVFSSAGIREGFLFEQLSPFVREQDVLLTACADMAARVGCDMAYAQELLVWMVPLFQKETDAMRRLRLACCLLHDVSLHIHPEYRASFAYARIVQSALVGLSHAERVMFGLALYHRYHHKLKDDLPGVKLLSPEQMLWARRFGAAAALAYSIAGGIAGSLHKSSLELSKSTILLHLSPSAKNIAGDNVQKRLETLVETL